MNTTLRRAGLSAAAGLSLCLALLPAGPAQAVTYVPCNNIPALKNAIARANVTGETVALASGCTYTLTAADNVDDGLPEISGNVRLSGYNVTIRRLSTTEFRIFHVLTGGSLTLHRITVTGGLTSSGGGILNQGALALYESHVKGNRATTTGGGIRNENALTMNHGSISGNTAGYWGGGLSNWSGTATISEASITGNDGGSFGGGIDNDNAVGAKGSVLRLTRSTVAYNRANWGGGLSNYRQSSALMIRSSVTGNTANTSGGGIYQTGGPVTLLHTPVTGNTPDNCYPAGSVSGCVGAAAAARRSPNLRPVAPAAPVAPGLKERLSRRMS